MLHLALLGTQNRINASFAVSANACRSMRHKVQKREVNSHFCEIYMGSVLCAVTNLFLENIIKTVSAYLLCGRKGLFLNNIKLSAFGVIFKVV